MVYTPWDQSNSEKPQAVVKNLRCNATLRTLAHASEAKSEVSGGVRELSRGFEVTKLRDSRCNRVASNRKLCRNEKKRKEKKK